jgi:hypothetical protein
MMTENQELLNKILTGIAQKNLNINTLETQKSDSLDFHDVAVWQIREALQDAFLAGMKTAMTL